MIHLDEDAVICDLAETYHVLKYRELSPKLVAVLCSGLSEDSRIKKKIAGRYLSLDELFLAALVDKVSLMLWQRTKDAERGINRPKSMVELFERPPEPKYKGFDSIEDYERKRAEILGA